MGNIIPVERSIIPSFDFKEDALHLARTIIKETNDIEKIGGYKFGVGFLDFGLKVLVDIFGDLTKKPLIYDHQKGGTDINEEIPEVFMDKIVRSRIKTIILFPLSGPASQYEWIKAAQDRSLNVIVGGEMTHPRFLDGDLSEGKSKDYTEIFKSLGLERNLTGYIRQSAPDDVYELAARMGITDFVVPGNKPERIKHYKSLIERCGVLDPVFYSPGLVVQGGKISEGAKAAGKNFHGIIGRAFKDSQNIKQTALEFTSQL